jgi:UDP:flavonoid glycosyltransferase YjiC (YdhE family)
MYPKRVPLFSTTIPEANLPMDVIPSDITFCGPIVLDTAPAAEQDSELVTWLQRGGAKTVLINLGTVFRYTEAQARIMAEVVATVLETRDDIQILWKYLTQDNVDGSVPESLKKYVDQGRLKVQQWLKIDPMSLLRTESVDLFVHHGGGNAYHEAVL